MRIVFSVVWLMLLLAFTTPAQHIRKPSPGAVASQATGALKVITSQAGSVVFINEVRHGATNDKGELDLPRVRAGSYAVRVRSVGFTDCNHRRQMKQRCTTRKATRCANAARTKKPSKRTGKPSRCAQTFPKRISRWPAA